MILATVQTYFLLLRGKYDVMICGHVCIFFRMMSFCLCENQSSLVLTYNAPWHVMTDLFASSRFISGFGEGKYSYCVLV